ncbi:MAG TPA: VCBS repeat-containing protein, partial [Verrucomicrobiae bacterium]|nr:VCBS repeat-containing protein [Verrucomicrobiae bacterium]
MKIKHLLPALAAACVFFNWTNSACATGTNVLQIQNSVAITYTTNFTGNFVNPSTPFSDTVNFSINSPESVAVADVNGDGKMDLICANSGAQNPGTLTVLTNDGTGNFVFASTVNVGNEPAVVLAVDVNGDGKVDLVSANESVSTLTVLTNDGVGNFTVSSSPAVGGLPT